MSRLRLNLAVLALIPLAALLLGSCGNSDASTEKTVGPIGPTTSGYYFEMSLTPSIIKTEDTSAVLKKITVWDANGLPVSGVTVISYAEESSNPVTDATGMASETWNVTGGDIMGPIYTHASVEDLTLTNYVQVVP